ncbi:MAG: ketol-acid reductoisomerase [Verrucomicrobia bacterium]|nr:MAG: ketol-acid reductoisomerase [Verrucomicrobiota bacterium]
MHKLPRRRTAARIYTDEDSDLRWLKGKTCAVIGFGAQGRAHALNLRDSGIAVVVGLYRESKSRVAARRAGLKVVDTPEAVHRADVIFLALPDTKMPEVYKKEIAPYLRLGQTLLVAHGFAIHYGTLVPRKDVDVVMVAPKGLGPMVRREFAKGRGVPALIAVHQNRSRHAKRTALAWAKGIGCTRAGVIETTFREETETDLFGEQAVLCGGTSALIRAGFETLVRAGYPPELAYFECLHELKFIVDLIHEAGINGMRALISDTAKWGELTVGPRIVDATVRRKMEAALREIRSGKFAREFIHEMKSGQPGYRKLLREARRHPIETVGRRLRGLMSWRGKNKRN